MSKSAYFTTLGNSRFHLKNISLGRKNMQKLFASLAIILISTVASACAPLFSTGDGVVEVSSLKVDLDESFVGSVEDFKQEPIVLSWIVSGDSAFSSEHGGEMYNLTFQKPSLQEGYFEEGYSQEFLLSENALSPDGSRSLEISKFDSYAAIHPFLEMASTPGGREVLFTLVMLQEVDQFNTKEVSEATFSWTRPVVLLPAKPLILPNWEYEDSTQPCVTYVDAAVHSFERFPEKRTASLFTNGKPDSDWDTKLKPYFGYLGLACKFRGGLRLSITAQFQNSAGKSEVADLEIESLNPGITRAEFKENIRRQKLKGCTDPLDITEFSASVGDCGFINVEVFQSDLNTGYCNFLGYWNDEDGLERIGSFEYCSNFQRGAFKESSNYKAYVKVSGIVSYTNKLGTENQVVSFTVLD